VQLYRDAVNAGFVRAGVSAALDVRERAASYLELLARWNRRINLTGFELEQPTEAAIDRLIVEPIRAASCVRPSARLALDVGSGGGSPALPIALACPGLRITLVEGRARKAAFLREASRVLGIEAEVVVGRFEDVSSRWANGTLDVVSMRAVRPDSGLVDEFARVLAVDGVFLWFGEIGQITNSDAFRATSAVGKGLFALYR
jgi:16S rRNA (guanine527-N7)-methyltransferase